VPLGIVARIGAAFIVAGLPTAASATFDCSECVFDPGVQQSYDYDYVVPPDGRTYRWTIAFTSVDPAATIRLAEPNQTEVFLDYRDGRFEYDPNPIFRFDQTLAPGLTTIFVRAPRQFDNCDQPGPDTSPCRATVHIWGNGTMLTVTGNAPIFAAFGESLVPEPAGWLLIIAGFGAAGIALRARRSRSRSSHRGRVERGQRLQAR